MNGLYITAELFRVFSFVRYLSLLICCNNACLCYMIWCACIQHVQKLSQL